MTRRVVLASANPGKLAEFERLLAPIDIELVTQASLGIDAAEESGETFVENALLKARHAARLSGCPAIADDSGVSVDALGGAPGVRSARFAGPEASDRENLEKLLRVLEDVPDERRGARFECVVVYMRRGEDPAPLLAQGTWEGTILRSPRGGGGFGYDPVFHVPALQRTAAELSMADKNRLSHRGQAMRQLLVRLQADLER